jgi:hypothetical protein
MYVCMYVYTYVQIHTHTHTHTHVAIYRFVCGARGDRLFSELDLCQRLVMFLLRLCIVCVCVYALVVKSD